MVAAEGAEWVSILPTSVYKEGQGWIEQSAKVRKLIRGFSPQVDAVIGALVSRARPDRLGCGFVGCVESSFVRRKPSPTLSTEDTSPF